MNHSARLGFSRCLTLNGDTASFCNKCFVTLAESRMPEILEHAERIHVCDPQTLEYWATMMHGSYPNRKDQG